MCLADRAKQKNGTVAVSQKIFDPYYVHNIVSIQTFRKFINQNQQSFHMVGTSSWKLINGIQRKGMVSEWNKISSSFKKW